MEWINAAHDSQGNITRVIAHLALLLARAAQDRKVQVSDADIRRLYWGTGDLGTFFELLSLAEVGGETSADIRSLMEGEPNDTRLLVLDLGTALLQEATVAEIATSQIPDMVGYALLKRASPQWLLWRAGDIEYFGTRLLRLPHWKEFTR